jgi:hypothetical protein
VGTRAGATFITLAVAGRGPTPPARSSDAATTTDERRIWNQHTYHVTNVREDGTIPQHEQPSWTRLNTFRTNAQINSTGVARRRSSELPIGGES